MVLSFSLTFFNFHGSVFLLFLVCSLCLKSMFITCFLDGLTEDRLICYKLQPCAHPPVGGWVVCLWISCAETFRAWGNVSLNFTFEAPSHEQYSWLSVLFFLETLCSFFSCLCMLVCALSVLPPISYSSLPSSITQETGCLCSLKGDCSVSSLWHRSVLPY